MLSALALREACVSALPSGVWIVRRSVTLSPAPRGGNIQADVLATNSETGFRLGIFPRWQQASGTAEEKILFQVLKVQMAVSVKPDCLHAAAFVLEGAGWTWRDYFLSGRWKQYVRLHVPTDCLSFSAFIERFSDGEYCLP